MTMTIKTWAWIRGAAIAAALGSAGAGCAAPPTALDRLREDDDAAVREATHELVARGEAALPLLRAELRDDDPRYRSRVKVAIGRITGQYGCPENGIIWRRSVAEAVGRGRPILVLHLFGKLDQEFC